MYKIEYYKDEKEKDVTYDDALYSSLNNGSVKWENYYAYLQEKYDLCYNVQSVTIDIEDIKEMKFDCFSNGILYKLYLMCKTNQAFDQYKKVVIPNNSIFMEELIYNIFKAEWLINEEIVDSNNYDELLRKRRYFEAMIDASDDVRDTKIQFRNKLFEYFIKTYDNLKENKENSYDTDKILKLEKNKIG